MVLALVALGGCGARPSPAASTAVLSVATYNLNYGLAGDAETTAAMAATGAEVLLLQEVSAAWRAVIEGSLAARWPHRCFVGSDWPAGGAAILSQHPLEGCARSAPPRGGLFPALAATVRAPSGPVRVVNLHLTPARGGPAVLTDLLRLPGIHRRELRTHHARLVDPNLPTIFAGDFNEDLGDGAVEALGHRGYGSALVEHAPEATTWRWPLGAMSIEKRLDHVMYDSAGLRCVHAAVLSAGRSDHRPVVAHFVAPAPRASLSFTSQRVVGALRSGGQSPR